MSRSTTIGIRVDEETMDLYKELTGREREVLLKALKEIIRTYVRTKQLDYLSLRREVDRLQQELEKALIEIVTLREALETAVECLQRNDCNKQKLLEKLRPLVRRR